MQAMPEMPDNSDENDAPDPLTAEQHAEIDELRAARRETLRPTVPDLEEILYRPLTVLDRLGINTRAGILTPGAPVSKVR